LAIPHELIYLVLEAEEKKSEILSDIDALSAEALILEEQLNDIEKLKP